MEYTKEFDRWNEKKKEADQCLLRKNFYIHAREVWWCSIGVNVGSEIDGKNENFERPILIAKVFSRDGFLGIPLTSKEKNHRYAVPIHHGKGISFANTSQLRILSKKRLLRKIGMANEFDFEKVISGLKRLF
jgi:mRNA interferase MazF